jgi:hypothetical protein
MIANLAVTAGLLDLGGVWGLWSRNQEAYVDFSHIVSFIESRGFF